MKPLLCVVDTNSLIHMRGIQVARKSLGLWLWREFTVGVSEEIIKEIQRQKKFALENRIQRQCVKSKWRFQNHADLLECVFLPPFYPNTANSKNRGELHNCCVALDAILSGKHRQVIFLTDEINVTDLSKNGFIARIFDTFPLGRIWSSLDFIVYLFLRHRKDFPLPEAKNALRDLNARICGDPIEAQSRLIAFNKKLRQIDQILSQLSRS